MLQKQLAHGKNCYFFVSFTFFFFIFLQKQFYKLSERNILS